MLCLLRGSASPRERPVVESGGKADFQYGNESGMATPVTKVDRVLRDGDEVRLGSIRMVTERT